MNIRTRWNRMNSYQRDAWIAKALRGWSVTKEAAESTGRYYGNPFGQTNKIGGLSGIWVKPIPRYSEEADAEIWISDLEELGA